MKTKSIPVVLFVVMFCVSLSPIDFRILAEPVHGPFENYYSGYPIPTEAIDQQQPLNGLFGTFQNSWWAWQPFKPSVSGYLTKVEFFAGLDSSVQNNDLHVEIWDTDQSMNPTTPLVDTVIYDTDIPVIAYWIELELSSQVSLTADTEYGIMFWTYSTLNMRLYGDTLNPYAQGIAHYSTNQGSSWSPWGGTVNDFAFKTYMTTGPKGASKIAWHSSGDYALAVTGYNNAFYNFTRETGQWIFEGVQGVNNILTDIIYHEYYGKFYMVGRNSAGHATAWSFMNNVGVMLGNPTTSQTGLLNGIEIVDDNGDSGIIFLATGQLDDGSALAAWYDGGWVLVDSGFSPTDDEALYDVTWNYRYTTMSKHYLVGVNENTGDGLLYSLDLGGNIASLMTDTGWSPMPPMKAIDWNPNFAVYDYAVIVGEGPASSAWKYYGGLLEPTALIGADDNLNDVCWHPDGSIAIIVGENAGNGVVYYHHAVTNEVVDMSDYLPSGTGALYGVSVKGPTSPASGIIVGYSGAIGAYPQASDTSTRVRINAAFPHIFNLGFWATANPAAPLGGGPSLLDTQVDVDTNYTFFVEANYTVGGVEQWGSVAINLTSWFDMGVAFGSSPPDPTWSDTDITRTRQFSITWTSVGGAVMNQPLGAPLNDEFAVVGSWEDPGVYANNAHRVYINVSFGRQTFAADGNGFGGGTGVPFWDVNFAQNDIDSWDFEYAVFDSANISARNESWGEYGINEAVSILASGNPTRNAPPGAGLGLMGPNSDVTYSANLQYWVNVSLVDELYLNGIPGPSVIPATNVGVRNINGQANVGNSEIVGISMFAGPGIANDRCVWGLPGPGGEQPTPLNGTYAFGDWGSDFNSPGAYTTAVQWWCIVPIVPEGLYWTVITYRIESN